MHKYHVFGGDFSTKWEDLRILILYKKLSRIFFTAASLPFVTSRDHNSHFIRKICNTQGESVRHLFLWRMPFSS